MPPINLIYAFHASLTQIMKGAEVSRHIKKAAEEVGFKGVPLSEDVQVNGMSALYFPKKDDVVAGRLHASIKGQ
ncbi:hypothetical protein BDR03DRAFT_1008645 [Suillus americanus]|nr:hypothetical protein BDR03DRAFT_1008645 [Suillus americanus]